MSVKRNKGTYASMENIFVPVDDQALVNGVSFLPTGNALPIANQQLAVINEWKTKTLTAAEATAANSLFVVMGTPNSANIARVNDFNIGHKANLTSGVLRKGKVTRVVGSKPSVGKLQIHAISGFTAMVEEVDYSVTVDVQSHKRDKAYDGRKHDQEITVASFAPTGTVNTTDYVLQRWITKANPSTLLFEGYRPFVMMGVDSTGGAVGTTLGTVKEGDAIPFMVDNLGQTISYTVDKPFVAAVNSAIADNAAVANWKVFLVDEAVAGTAANVDTLLTIGLDEPEYIVVDEWVVSKARVQSFTTAPATTNVFLSRAEEASGTAKAWYLEWKDRAANFIHNLQHYGTNYEIKVTDSNVIPNYINQAEPFYYAFTVEYENNEETITIDHKSYGKVIILMAADFVDEAADASVGYDFTVRDTATQASLNAILGAFLTASNNVRTIDFEGESLLATPFGA